MHTRVIKSNARAISKRERQLLPVQSEGGKTLVKRTNKALMFLSLMLVAMMASACSMNRVLPEAADEEAMMVEVRGAIADAVPGKTFDLGVDVTENGVVTLTGEVDSASDRDAIVTRVGQVKGVRSVNASGLRART
jgi:hypothetical protein